MDTRYPDIEVKLTGHDGNAFMVLGRVVAALRKAKVPEDEITEFKNDAFGGDYNHLLATCMAWVSVS